MHDLRIETITAEDIRFRLPENGPGSDAVNYHTDYSNPYVTVTTNDPALTGAGIGMTIGRGNEMICQAVRELAELVEGRTLGELVLDFRSTWRRLANPLQSRWLGPCSGPYYMAAGAITNALFDLWAKVEQRPLWRLLADLTPEQVIAMIDFRYVEHLLTPDEALKILGDGETGKAERIRAFEDHGLPCYFTTWIGTGTEDLLELVRSVRAEKGMTHFKMKVGVSVEDDRARLQAVRAAFGDEITWLTDANQVWSVPQAIRWMQQLAEFDIEWIEEPVAPDLIDGHRRVREALAPLGIEVVTGEQCPNSHVAAQLIAGGAIDRYQADACRVMGPPENMLIMLIAAKHKIPVCPHAGGSGLDEIVPHLAGWNFVSCAAEERGILVEQVGFCSHHFDAPSVVQGGRVQAPRQPGYLVGLNPAARQEFVFPHGPAWRTA